MRILFMGTPEFSVPCLERLINDGHDVVAVVTQKDKPKGRGHKMVPTPVKECALKYSIPVYQPETLKNDEFLSELKSIDPELIVVVAYGQILPEYVLSYPKYKCINVHASLLPKYRGAGPIQWCIINGEKTTGVTIMNMEKGLDTGDMLIKRETLIGEYENCESLYNRLSIMGADLLSEAVELIKDSKIIPERQNDSESSYAPMITKETGKIDWNDSAENIINLVRGTYIWPVSHTLYKGEPLKIYSAVMGNNDDISSPGQIVSVNKKNIEIKCGNKKTIFVDEVQFFGKKRMSIESYLNGNNIDKNIVLGE